MAEGSTLDKVRGRGPLGLASESRVGFRTSQVVYAGVFAAILVTLVGGAVEGGINQLFANFNIDGDDMLPGGSQEWAVWMSRLITGPAGVLLGLGALGLIIRAISRWRFGRHGPAVADRFLN